MENNKKQIEQIIIRYLSGKANPQEIDMLTEWIFLSPENKKIFMQMRNIWEITHPVFSPQEIDTNKALANLMHAKGKKISLFAYWQRIASILLLPFIGLSLFLYLQNTPTQQKKLPITYQQVFAPYGTYTQLGLPDGSKVWLNAGSSVKYPIPFEPQQREVFLSGEAYFEIVSDEKNPFVVKTNKLNVVAKGTAFNIEAYPKDSLISVTMVEGILDVVIGKSHAFNLLPGQRVCYNQDNDMYQISTTDPYKWYAWKDGKMVFRNDRLDYVFKRIGQTFNVDIELNDREIASHPYRATFEYESLDVILRLLKMTAPIRYEEENIQLDQNKPYKTRKIRVYKSMP